MSKLQRIEKDVKYKKFISNVKHGIFKVNSDKLISELQEMHASRLSRKLTPEDVLRRFKTRFLESVLQNNAWRSRAVEIKMECHRLLIKLDELLPVLKKYIKSNYAKELQEYFKTQSDRDSYVDMLLEQAIRQKHSLEGVSKHADLLISDLDAAGWTAKGIIDVMELTSKRDAVSL